MSEYQDIPYGDNLENIKKCVIGSGLSFKVRKRDQMIRIFYDEPIQLYWLGCNVVSLGAGLFESSITTHACKNIKP